MKIERAWLEQLIFGTSVRRRYTQDSPVLPDVWIRFGEKLTRGEPPVLDLLLTPHMFSTAGELYATVLERVAHERRPGGHSDRMRAPGSMLANLLAAQSPPRDDDGAEIDDAPCEEGEHRLAYNQSTVVGCLYLDEVVRVLLPLTSWWSSYVCPPADVAAPGPRFGLEPMKDMLAQLEAELEAEEAQAREEEAREMAAAHATPRAVKRQRSEDRALLWLATLVGSMLAAAEASEPDEPTWEARRRKWDDILKDRVGLVRRFRELMEETEAGAEPPPPLPADPQLYVVSRNRRAGASIANSVKAVKADAARRVFRADCSKLAWAIVDSGIDATHPAFRKRRGDEPLDSAFRDERGRPGNGSRVEATFDFTCIRTFLSGSAKGLAVEAEKAHRQLEDARKELADATAASPPADASPPAAAASPPAAAASPPDGGRTVDMLERKVKVLEQRHAHWQAFVDRRTAAEDAKQMKTSLLRGRVIDWDELRPLLEIDHLEGLYRAPYHEHGTHVAGILAADWRRGEDGLPGHFTEDLQGVCPDIRLYDFRVFDDDGNGDEFSVMAALQFLRHLNAHRELPLIHGANMSLAIRHDVANYACGQTPVCEECERVVKAGVVVVAAAGNYGYNRFSTLTYSGAPSSYEGYSAISITDPGNADAVITVGSTHRIEPHTYGVSYFSSRGPTGDGRYKPDLVAPGEKITATIPGRRLKVMDGTSMAAPHVSGAAALILARYQEFVGRPAKVKQILVSTATDLGRDRYFQGAGMVDVLRALQSV